MWFLGLIILLVKIGTVLIVLLMMAAFLIFLERKLLARLQVRIGPNPGGFHGFMQPFADAVKLVFKEDTVPENADRIIFLFAPALVAAPALLIFAVVPFTKDFTWFGQQVAGVITDLNVGLLYVMAMASMAVYGVALGGWASNSKYSLLGGIRGVAQMSSYKLSFGLSLVPVVMMAQSFSLVEIVNAQAKYPFFVVQPLAFAIFMVSAMAESKRLPFDLPEAENELLAGYHTEYSGMRFGFFFFGEYLTMVVLGVLTAIFFLGGWHGPWFPPFIWFFMKVMLVPLFLIWTRAAIPRFRYDQLMSIGWKVLIPLALVNILITGGVLLAVG